MRLYTNLLRKYIYNFSTIPSNSVLEQLKQRSLIRVSGNDAAALLQGVITNDMQHLSHARSMFAMFLNNKGRVLYDTIVYRISTENTYLLEVDKQVADAVKKHLIIYRLRRKADISSVDDQFQIWAHFNPLIINATGTSKDLTTVDGGVVPCSILGENTSHNNVTIKNIEENEVLIFRDPRLSSLGSRILVPTDCQTKLDQLFTAVSEPIYKRFRYQLGVGEGVDELPPGNCFPLEANGDYLHGVSFHKGCYIGQELTARTYHTGVIRKRLMPLILATTFKKDPSKDETIKYGETNVGKLRGYEQTYGLALLRIQQALEANQLTINNIIATTAKPTWWPLEAVKEKISKGKL